MLLPTTECITKHLFSSIKASYEEEGGFKMLSYGPFGAELTNVIVPALAGAVAGGVLLYTRAEPEFTVSESSEPLILEASEDPAMIVKKDLGALAGACMVYKIEYKKYPDTLEQLLVPTDGYPEGFYPPKELPADPWGNPYHYKTFAGNGKAFIGVKFLDGGHQWDEAQGEATPANFTGPGDTTRILLRAGDLTCHRSFACFRETLRADSLMVTADKVDYRFGAGEEHLEMTPYDAASPESFTLPRINETPVDLRPSATYHSPYLNGKFGSDRISATVGPVARILDFSEQGK
jgi:hypothetical protein